MLKYRKSMLLVHTETYTWLKSQDWGEKKKTKNTGGISLGLPNDVYISQELSWLAWKKEGEGAMPCSLHQVDSWASYQ